MSLKGKKVSHTEGRSSLGKSLSPRTTPSGEWVARRLRNRGTLPISTAFRLILRIGNGKHVERSTLLGLPVGPPWPRAWWVGLVQEGAVQVPLEDLKQREDEVKVTAILKDLVKKLVCCLWRRW